jgi:hypothetical protein
MFRQSMGFSGINYPPSLLRGEISPYLSADAKGNWTMKLEVLSVRVYAKKGEGSVALPLKEPPRPIHPGVGKSSPTLMEGT